MSMLRALGDVLGFVDLHSREGRDVLRQGLALE